MTDIHLYVDASGSSYGEKFTSHLVAAVRAAQALGTRLFVSYFTHQLGEDREVMLHDENGALMMPKQAAAQFFDLPVDVWGGTDFELVWFAVARQNLVEPRLNLVVTDFEWMPGGTAGHLHPDNLWYSANSSADHQQRFTDMFVTNMEEKGYRVQDRILNKTYPGNAEIIDVVTRWAKSQHTITT